MIIQPRDSAQFNLRLPDSLKERIKEDAAKNGRSMNAQIVFVLTGVFSGRNEKTETAA